MKYDYRRGFVALETKDGQRIREPIPIRYDFSTRQAGSNLSVRVHVEPSRIEWPRESWFTTFLKSRRWISRYLILDGKGNPICGWSIDPVRADLPLAIDFDAKTHYVEAG